MRNIWKFKISSSELILALILIVLPVSIKLTNYLIVLLIVKVAVTTQVSLIKVSLFKMRSKILIQILPFLFSLITLAYSDSIQNGLKSLEKYLPLLLFPILFSIINTSINLRVILRTFAATIFSMIIVCFAYNIFILLTVPLNQQEAVGDAYNKVSSIWNALTNENLVRPFEIGPIYLSMYTAFATVIIILDDIVSNKYLKAGLFFVMLFFNVLLGSRLGIASLGLTVIVFMLFYFKKYRYYTLFGFVTVASILLVTIAINPVLKKRYILDVSTYKLPEDVSQWNGANIRYAVWQCSYKAFKSQPLLGYGVGDQNEARRACYQEFSFYGPFGTDLNSHNQFLEYALIGGLGLVILFILQLYTSINAALVKSNKQHLFFLIIFILTCLGESLLEQHKGIVFFSYFNSLFIFCTFAHNNGDNME